MTGVGGGESVRVEGQVTDDAGYGKTMANVEGAVVTAAAVSADGSTRALDGSATTNAEGRFALDVETDADVMVLTAAKDAFTARVLVRRSGTATVRAMPMTTESTGEADVYVAAKARDEDEVTEADVAVHVDADVAAELAAGTTTAAEVAAAIAMGVKAEERYARDEGEANDEELRSAREQRRQSFLDLQAALYAATTASAEASAVQAFEEAVAEAYVAAGLSADVQAKARQAGKAALMKFAAGTSAKARFALRKRATLLVAQARARAIEAAFEASGAAQARINTLVSARTEMMARLRAALNEAALTEAEAEYAATVEAELAAELQVDTTLLNTAKTSLLNLKVALDNAIASAASADVIASAHATYFAEAETVASSTLSTSTKADLGGRVIALLSIE